MNTINLLSLLQKYREVYESPLIDQLLRSSLVKTT